MPVSTLPRLSCAVSVAVMLVACGPAIPIAAPSGGTTSEGASDSSGTGSTTTAAPDEPDPGVSSSGNESSGSHDDADEPPSNFLLEPDGGGVSYECSFLAQDCPPGEKCNAWANDGGGAWNATKCVPVVPDPDEPGEPCTVEGSGTSGIDTCELGAMCWDVDPKTNEGTCVAFCQGDEANPICEDPDTQCEGRDILLCLPLCCPLEQNCPAGHACYPINEDFSCGPDASGDLGAFGDPCEFINVCDPGLMCLDAGSVPPGLPCEGASGCCTAFCALGSDSCSELHPALECVPWFEDGAAPPGFELTGACVVPS